MSPLRRMYMGFTEFHSHIAGKVNMEFESVLSSGVARDVLMID